MVMLYTLLQNIYANVSSPVIGAHDFVMYKPPCPTMLYLTYSLSGFLIILHSTELLSSTCERSSYRSFCYQYLGVNPIRKVFYDAPPLVKHKVSQPD